MKLQKKFDKTRQYEAKTYEQAAQEVYQNKDYMFELYLPGNLLAHFLWWNHYKQHIFFLDEFLPLVREHSGNLYYDIGVGAGFYSKEMLRNNPNLEGVGFDPSPYSMEYTIGTLSAFGLADRYTGRLQDITEEKVEQQASFLTNIEVLEHLEDPQSFLIALNGMLEPGGYGLISAALTAPILDHIYLYNEADEVAEQVTTAGFKILKYIEDPAYEPAKPTDSVPRNVAFIVTK